MTMQHARTPLSPGTDSLKSERAARWTEDSAGLQFTAVALVSRQLCASQTLSLVNEPCLGPGCSVSHHHSRR